MILFLGKNCWDTENWGCREESSPCMPQTEKWHWNTGTAKPTQLKATGWSCFEALHSCAPDEKNPSCGFLPAVQLYPWRVVWLLLYISPEGWEEGNLEVGGKKRCDLKAFSFGKQESSLDQILLCWESFLWNDRTIQDSQAAIEVFEERPAYILSEDAIKCCNHADREKGGEERNKKKNLYGNLSLSRDAWWVKKRCSWSSCTFCHWFCSLRCSGF